MSNQKLTIEELRDLINKGEAKDPLIFLEAIMNGQDPRMQSSVYELICEIDSLTDGDVTKDDWEELVNHATDNFKYRAVSVTESTAAAKTLAEYLHSKRKHIELSGSVSDEADPNANPLTEQEIDLFKEKFNEEF